MDKDWNMISTDKDLVIPFQWRDETPGGSNLGRAEFTVEISYNKKTGNIDEYWVWPAQQRNMNDCWHFMGGDIDFSIMAYEGLDDPKVWLMYWCKEHKRPGFHLYVPSYSKFLVLSRHGLVFTKKDWNR